MMNGINPLKIPEIKRSRDYRLYDFNGGRYLDLFLDGGRAVLGHKHGRSVLMMKNSLEKGLAASYPGVWDKRLKKQLKMLYPEITGVSVVFSGCLTAAGRDGSEPGAAVPVLRPFEFESLEAAGFSDAPFEVLLPLPGSGAYRVICTTGAADALPAADAVPQYIYSGLCRAAADLKLFAADAKPGVWAAFNSKLWERRGPWLYPILSGEQYAAIFDAFLKRGMLLSPDPELPSCAPYRFTMGEIKPIKEVEREFKGLSEGVSF